MKIAFFELEKWEEEYLKNKLSKHKLLFFENSLNENNVNKIKGCDIIGIFIYSKITKNIIEQLPRLKAIMTLSTGFEHIDLKECKKHNITVCNVPLYGENTVAEHTFALILALSRKIVDSVDRARKDDFSLSGLRGFDLKGKVLGVIGPGNIGQHVIRLGKGFEMKVIAYSNHKNSPLSKKLGFSYVTLTRLLQLSDIITIHCPLNEHTYHLISMKNVKQIKKGAYLINTARGGIVDTNALVYALGHGIISGAGLDVLEGEDEIREEKQLLHKNFIAERDLKILLKDHILLKNRNVLITAHNAFNSREALNRILDTTIENINCFKKKKLVNVV